MTPYALRRIHTFARQPSVLPTALLVHNGVASDRKWQDCALREECIHALRPVHALEPQTSVLPTALPVILALRVVGAGKILHRHKSIHMLCAQYLNSLLFSKLYCVSVLANSIMVEGKICHGSKISWIVLA